jgi:Zn-dependent protease with chaperone function
MKNLFLILFLFLLPKLGFAQEAILEAIPTKDFQQALLISYQIGLFSQDSAKKYEKQMEKIREIGYRIAGQTNDARPFTFQFIKDPSVNAFAMPGGFIFITEGMIKLNLSDDEWAHLLGHELTHVIKNHHQKSQRGGGFLKQLGITLASMALIMLASNELNKNNENLYTNDAREQRQKQFQNLYTVAIYGPYIANVLYSLKYTRELEKEADYYGRKFAAAAGFNPKGAESLFNKLSKSDNHHIDHIWRSHPEMLDRTYIATLSEEKVIQKDFTEDTLNAKLHIQKTLLQYSYYFLNKKNGFFGKSQKNDYLLGLHNNLIFLHLSELILNIYKHSSLAPKALQLSYEQLIIIQLFNQALPPWGKFYSLYKEVDPTHENCLILEKQSAMQYKELTNAIKEKRGGIPTCLSLIESFPDHPEIFTIRLSLLQSLYQNRSYKEIPSRFLTACEYAKTEADKKELAAFGKRYIAMCDKPYQLYLMAFILGEKDFSNEAKKKYYEITIKCESLKEIANILDVEDLKDLFADKDLIKENALQKTFEKAKLKEKQQLKGDAYVYYNELLLYGENTKYAEMAEEALKTLGYE